MILEPSAVEALLARSITALRPPRRRPLSAWADEHFYLSAESAAEPGKWRALPYQPGIMDAFTDPAVTQVTVMKSARVGWTKIVNAVCGYYINEDPCPIMVVQPTLDDAKGYSQEEIAPMLRDCPSLARIMPPRKTRTSNNTLLAKRFPGGSLTLVGANSGTGFRRVSRKVVLFDEVDGYPLSAGLEGDPVQLGIKRTDYYWDRKIGAGSTPTTQGRSRIEQMFLAGDQRRYYVPCPHCAHYQVLQFKHFKWPKGRPEQAVYVCIECGTEIEHRYKFGMVKAGEWRPGPHPQFPDTPAPLPFHGHASFHIWAAYSFSPNATWGQVCSEFVAAQFAGVEVLKTFVNTGLGETWTEKGEAPEWERLYMRRDTYPLGTCPEGVLFLTAGVDVQKDHLVYEVVGWGREKRSWVIDAGSIPGDHSDFSTKGPWLKLDALLSRRFPHASGLEISIAMMAVDSGAFTQDVYNWCRKKPMSRVIAVKGVDSAQVLIGSPSRVDVVVSGRKLKRGYKMWPVAPHLAKSELYGWLGLMLPTDEERAAGAADPPGYCRFPQLGEDYFKQLTAEQLVTTKSKKGFAVFTWEVIPGRQNHHLDARVYARAAAALAGLDRLKESDWQALERAFPVKKRADLIGAVTEAVKAGALGPDAALAAAVAPAPPSPDPPPPPKPTPARKRQAWLGNRSNDWLKRRR